MKKIYLFIIAIIVAILPNDVLAFASYNSPSTLLEYKAKCSNSNGADYYEDVTDDDYTNLKKIGSLPYGTKITITYERAGYARFSKGIIKTSDIESIVNKLAFNSKNVRKTNHKVITLVDVLIHSGPAEGYKVIGSVPKLTEIILEYEPNIYEDENSIWYGIKYNGVEGWIPTDGVVKPYSSNDLVIDYVAFKQNHLLYLKEDISIINENGKKISTIKKGTILKSSEFYSNYYKDPIYVSTSNGINGYIDSFDGIYKYYNYALGSITEEASMFKEIVGLHDEEFESKERISVIPASTKVKVIYENINYENPEVYVEYNGKKGWIDSYKIKIDENTIKNPETEESTTTTTTTTPLEIEEPTTKKEELEEKNKTISSELIIIFCLSGALLIALTVLITILLVKKR